MNPYRPYPWHQLLTRLTTLSTAHTPAPADRRRS